jgi:hypothetical protein
MLTLIVSDEAKISGNEQWYPPHLAKDERDMGHPAFVRE